MVTVNLVDVDMGIGEVRTYSGRGMYGDYCLGLKVDDVGELIEYIKAVADDVYFGSDQAGDINEDHPLAAFYEVIENISSDSMGLGKIFYWRGVRVEGNDENI